MIHRLALTLIIGVFLLTLSPHSLKAGASPPMSFPEALMWRHIIEQDDLLIVGRYVLTADGTTVSSCGVSTDWDDCQPTDAYTKLLDEDGSLVEQRNLKFLGPALTGFYLTADEVTASTIDFTDALHDVPQLQIYSSPVLFIPNTTITRNLVILPSTAATQTQSLTDLRTQIVRLVEQEIQNKNIDTDLTNPYTFTPNELVLGGQITLAGIDYVTAVSPLIPVIIPEVFQLTGSLFTEAMGFSFQAFLTTNAVATDTTLALARTDPFTAGDIIRIRDTAGFEMAVVVSVDSTTQITIDTDPDTGGNQGLANGYTVVNLGHAVIADLFSQRASQTNPSNSAFATLMGEFGVSTWVGGFLFISLATIGVAAAGGAFSGSWTGGLGIIPILLIMASDFGVIQTGALFAIVLFFLLGGAILYAKGVGR